MSPRRWGANANLGGVGGSEGKNANGLVSVAVGTRPPDNRHTVCNLAADALGLTFWAVASGLEFFCLGQAQSRI